MHPTAQTAAAVGGPSRETEQCRRQRRRLLLAFPDEPETGLTRLLAEALRATLPACEAAAGMHEHATETALEASTADAPAPALAPTPALLLRLQRTAGNQATCQVLARYEAGEHSQFGTAGKNVTIGGYTFDQRYLVSLGDYYKDSDKLMGAKKDEIKELIALIDRDETARTGKGGSTVKEDEWTAWSTKWRSGDDVYMELNKSNEHHFAPATRPSGRTTTARRSSSSSGNGSGSVSEKARLLNGFGLHFLTDAFAAGHMIDKIALKDSAKKSLKVGTNRAGIRAGGGLGILATQKCVDALAGMDIKDGAIVGDWAPRPSRGLPHCSHR